MSTLFLAADRGACAHYRCYNPVHALTLAGYDCAVGHESLMKDTLEYSTVVLQRQYDLEIGYNVDLWHSKGIKVFYEIDDLLTDIPMWNPARPTYAEKRKYVEKLLVMCDGIIVSTEPLAAALSRYNENILVAPNYMDLSLWDKACKAEELTVGWMGGPTHLRDLEQIHGVLDRFDTRVVVAGMLPTWAAEEWEHRDYFKFGDTPEQLADFDIGLAPLEDGHFNDCKSCIKFMEYALSGAATIASPVGPYARSIIHGETGYLAKNGKDWIRYLRRLIEDEDTRRAISEAARSWVIEERSVQNCCEEIAENYVGFFESITPKGPRDIKLVGVKK